MPLEKFWAFLFSFCFQQYNPIPMYTYLQSGNTIMLTVSHMLVTRHHGSRTVAGITAEQVSRNRLSITNNPLGTQNQEKEDKSYQQQQQQKLSRSLQQLSQHTGSIFKLPGKLTQLLTINIQCLIFYQSVLTDDSMSRKLF